MKEDLLARSNVTDCSPAQVKRLRPKETKNGITTKCDFSLYTCIRLQTLEAHFKHLNVCVCEGKGRGRICSISTILFGFLFLPFMGTCYFFSPIDYFFFCHFIWKGRVPVPVTSAPSSMKGQSFPIRTIWNLEIQVIWARSLFEHPVA